jgi:putative spermidine/putrescine transport system ATP-binding protein
VNCAGATIVFERAQRILGLQGSGSQRDAARVAGAVEVSGITKRFGSLVAVHPTSFVVPAGAFVTLLGPSGSGKTTILKMIAGFEEPSAGSVLVSGRDVTSLAPYRRNIGFVFQQYALFPHLTVAENVAYPLQMRRMARVEIRKAVSEALDLVRLSDLADRHPSQLSGGQQQRVALARAVVFRPPVLLMDEPMAALDKRLRDEMQIEVRNLQRTLKITTIAVTHDQGEALVMSDLILVLAGGTLQQIGSPTDLYHNPQSEFVAGFVGESNILHGRIERGPAGPALALEGGIGIALGQGHWPADGSEAVGVIRPEAIDMSPTRSGRPIELEARIVDRIFCGDAVRLRVRLSDAVEVVAKMRSGKSLVLPEIGEAVTVAWNPDDMVIIHKQ